MDEYLERFLSYLDKDRQSNTCWNWLGSKKTDGYGQFWCDGKNWRAHRWSYTYFVGSIPNRLQIDHLCKNRACVNPYHLEPVTQSTNTIRGDLHAYRITHCPKGHEYSKDNTYIHRKVNGLTCRHCRECKRIRARVVVL